jgi:DNA (cytosine-5)-methyltransferase 1
VFGWGWPVAPVLAPRNRDAVKPRLLDLFCGAGGAAVGYHRAGFDVIGIDIAPQPNYPFRFHQADALDSLDDYLEEGDGSFSAIHASPPCQSYSRHMRHFALPKPMLIDAVRDRLIATGVPWVIENVMGAPLPFQSDLFGAHGVMLCGTSFGLRVQRHRLFECSFSVPAPPCRHSGPAMNPHNQAARDLIYAEFGRSDPEIIWQREMGVEWMGRREARQAIPPAYTEHIGGYLLASLNAPGELAA